MLNEPEAEFEANKQKQHPSAFLTLSLLVNENVPFRLANLFGALEPNRVGITLCCLNDRAQRIVNALFPVYFSPYELVVT